MKNSAPLKKLDTAYINRAGFPEPVGTRVTIASVVNSGTKRNPVWRFYARGMWFYVEDLSPTPIL